MPVLSKFSAAPDIWKCENGAIVLEECKNRRAEKGIDGDTKSAVA